MSVLSKSTRASIEVSSSLDSFSQPIGDGEATGFCGEHRHRGFSLLGKKFLRVTSRIHHEIGREVLNTVIRAANLDLSQLEKCLKPV